MGKAMEWLKNNWLTAIIWVFSTIAIVIAIVIVGAIIAVPFIGWHDFLEIRLAELSRLFVFCVGGIGGAYGLQIAIKRQETFSHQGFNDRLGRGVESLANDDVVIRNAGVLILVDLANSANEAQKFIVVNVIYDFFRSKASIELSKGKFSEAGKRQDVQNALDFLLNLSLDEREKLLQNRLVDGRLNFICLDFSHLDITNKMMKNIDFSGATIRNVYFQNGSIFDSNFTHANIEGSRFFNMIIEETDFFKTKIASCEFNLVRFIGGRFKGQNKIDISYSNSLPIFICTEFERTELNFSDKINNPNAFFELCYYQKGQRPSNLDKSREYELTMGGSIMDGVGFFVKSNKPWSGQSVREWVAVELAAIKLDIAEDRRAITAHPIDASAEDIIEADKKVSAAKKELQAAQERFKKFQAP